jgi:hypothetical protein
LIVYLFKVKNTLIEEVDGFDQYSIVYLLHQRPQWLILRRSLGLSLSCKLTTKVVESSKLTITLAGGRGGRGGGEGVV